MPLRFIPFLLAFPPLPPDTAALMPPAMMLAPAIFARR